MQLRATQYLVITGFVLGFIVLVLIIIPRYFRLDDTKMSQARYKMRALQESLDRFKEHYGEYPRTEEGLNVLLEKRDPHGKPFFTRSIIDPWGVPYRYRSPGVHNKASYDLWTYGADNLPGGYKKNADIKNW